MKESCILAEQNYLNIYDQIWSEVKNLFKTMLNRNMQRFGHAWEIVWLFTENVKCDSPTQGYFISALRSQCMKRFLYSIPSPANIIT